MAEIGPIMYDYLNPGLSTLQELSINAFIAQLWHWEIDKHHTKGFPKNAFSLTAWMEIALKFQIMPKIPSKIYNLIEEYAKRFKLSLHRWLYERYYYKANDMLNLLREGITADDILEIFDDFACDSHGSIHNVRTARRMILSDRINQIDKFNIACEYCFEEDVRRLWPSVSAQIDLSKLSRYDRPLEYYWVHRIKSQLSKESRTEYFKLGFPRENISNETMLESCPPHAWSSFQYFWHKLTLERQWAMVSRMLKKSKLVFAKFILPMLNEDHLTRFITGKGADFMFNLITEKDECEKYYRHSPYRQIDDDGFERQICVLSVWNYIKNKMNEKNFMRMVSNLLDIEAINHIVKDALNDTDKRPSYEQHQRNTEFETLCFCEIWSSAPESFKLSATEHILPKKRFPKRKYSSPVEARETRFLVEMLQCATWETKKTFWKINWNYLMTSTRLQDFQHIMHICLDSENKINQFKEDVLSKYENIHFYCITLFQKCCFEKLDSFLTFCYPETQKRKYFKQRFLKLNLLCANSIFNRFYHINHGHTINEFIEDAYETTDLAKEVKNQFMTSLPVQRGLVDIVPLSYDSGLSEFVDTFELKDEVKRKLKQDFVEKLKSGLVDATLRLISIKCLQQFVVWCLEDENEIIKFKQSISPVEVLHNTAQNRKRDKNSICKGSPYAYSDYDYFRNFYVFLKWYFVDVNEIEQFETKYSEVIDQFRSKEMKERVDVFRKFNIEYFY